MSLDYTISGKCNGITKAGLPCKHRVIFANGFCKQHGGKNPPEVLTARLERMRQKCLRQAERWNRKLKKWGLR